MNATRLHKSDGPPTPQPRKSDGPILEVENLTTRFRTARGVVHAVQDVGFSVNAGDTLAIVGESGSGKSVTAMSIMRMVRRPGRIESGRVSYRGRDLLSLSERDMRTVRGAGIAMVFQDPMSSLNPAMRIREQLVEGMLAHGKFSGVEAKARALDLLKLVGIPDPDARLVDYPLVLSGGMRQRVMIAIAMANQPDVILADEPTTALDVTIQAQVLDVLTSLNREFGTAIVMITHNLGVVARTCSRAVVMYAGRTVEQATTEELFADPRHPYTRGLLEATPRLRSGSTRRLVPIPGRPPALIDPLPGCAFAPRCRNVEEACRSLAPPHLIAGDRTWDCFASVDGALPMASPPTEAVVPTGSTEQRHDLLDPAPVMRVDRVTRTFPLPGGRSRSMRALDEVSLDIRGGEVLGIVGESGCGKSTLARVILGIHPATSGRVEFDGQDVTNLRGRALRDYRAKVQMVFQDPYSSLNPRMTVGAMLAEPIALHDRTLARKAVPARVSELLELVGLDPATAARYPHEFSGGQRQRIAIARALAVRPALIVCDEALSALDVSLQAQILNLFKDLGRRLGLTYVFIGHDLATVRHISDRIAVMYLGQIVEVGTADDVVNRPQHPYTASLLSAVPEPDPILERGRERIVLAGDVPSPSSPPPGCRFHTRCPIGPSSRPERTVCTTSPPPLLAQSGEGTAVACHFPGELLPPATEESP